MPLQRGMTDEFEVVELDVGEITSISIGHDGFGFGSAWHLQQVRATGSSLTTGSSLCSLGGHRSSSSLSFSLFFSGRCGFGSDCLEAAVTGGDLPPRPGQVVLLRVQRLARQGDPQADPSRPPPAAPRTSPCSTRVTVHTTDCRNAGTDSDITCVVYGDSADTGTQKLDNSKNNMERGHVSAWGKAEGEPSEDMEGCCLLACLCLSILVSGGASGAPGLTSGASCGG